MGVHKMKLFGAFLTAVLGRHAITSDEKLHFEPEAEERASLDFGINYVNCDSDYFRSDKAWPLEGSSAISDFGTTVRLCQNRNGSPHKLATLFSVTDRVPVYSAVKVRRDPSKPTNARPNSNWHHVALGLCLEEGYNLPTRQSFYSNIDSTYSNQYEFCGHHQALDDDYKGNTGDLNIDRGHVVPNAVLNQDLKAQETTFTLTNIAPQHSNFNQRAWQQLECMVRMYLEDEIPNEYAWTITGIHGKNQMMNVGNSAKREVRVPAYYWKAFCYSSGSITYSWVYIQRNLNDQTASSGDNVMTVAAFSSSYLRGQAIFDSACQNASLGPWFAIKEDWMGYRNKWNCH